MYLRTRSTRLLGAAALIIILAGCDSAITSPPPPPPPPASPPPPPPPPAGVTVSGIVLEFTATGEHPVPNLRLKVWAGRGDIAVGGVELADTVTDARGRYTITHVSAAVLFFQTAPGSEYRFLCGAYPVIVRGPSPDLLVVHTSWSGNRPPPNIWFT